MTTYYKKYHLRKEEKDLLRDLLIYQISKYDSKIESGEKAPYLARRSSALDFLYQINNEQIGGNDSIMIMMEDIIELCEFVTDEERLDYQRTTLKFGDNNGLIGILITYPNTIIEGLKRALSHDNLIMTSTNSFSK